MTRQFLPAVLVTLMLTSPAWAQGTVAPHPREIRGQIRLADGRPAPAGIAVYLEMLYGGGAAGQTQTDSSGKFDFQQLPQAVYEVHIRAVGYERDYQTVDLISITQGYISFVLKPEATSKAPVVPPEGPGAMVSAADANIPDSARKSFEAAEQLLQSGKDFDKSMALLKKATSEYPQYSQAYLVMGVAYSSRKNWSEAETALQQAIKANEKNAAAYVALGAVKNELQHYDDSAKYLLKAVQLAPDSADAHFELGRTYCGLANWQAADEQMGKANQLRPGNAEQHIMLGNILLRERNAPGALKEFQEGLRLDPQGPLAEPTRQMIERIQTALKQAENK